MPDLSKLFEQNDPGMSDADALVHEGFSRETAERITKKLRVATDAYHAFLASQGFGDSIPSHEDMLVGNLLITYIFGSIREKLPLLTIQQTILMNHFRQAVNPGRDK